MNNCLKSLERSRGVEWLEHILLNRLTGNGEVRRPVPPHTTMRHVQIAVGLCFGALLIEPVLRAQGSATLTEAAQVRTLSPEEASRRLPVRLQGVVTYHDPSHNILFVQDASAGIFIRSHNPPRSLAFGVRVELEGVTGPGDFAPIISEASIAVAGTADMPLPFRTTVDHMKTGKEDGQWVEIQAYVRSVQIKDAHLELKVAGAGEQFVAIIPGITNAVAGEGLVDARVRMEGVCGSVFDEKRRFNGIRMFVPSLAFVTVDEAPLEDPFLLPTRPIQSLVQFNPYRVPGHRVKVRGVVTLSRPEGTVFVWDETDSLLVRTSREVAVEAGDVVEVAGFPEFNPFTPQLDDSIVRKVGSGGSVRAHPMSAREAKEGRADGELVEMEGRLLEVTEFEGDRVFVMEETGVIFSARIPEPATPHEFDSLRRGSRLSLTGICSIQENSARRPVGFRVLLRSPADVVVLHQPSWWTAERAQAALTLLCGLGLAGLAWLIMLLARVRKQTAIIRERLNREIDLEKRCHELFENANDIIYTHDLEGNITSMNKAGERTLGYMKDEAAQINIRAILSLDSLKKAERMIRRNLGGEVVPAYELELLTKDGGLLPVEVNSRAIYQGPKPVGIQAIVRDVSERRQSSQALRDSEERYRRLFETNPLPMWIYEVETMRFLAVNAAAVSHYGYSEEEFLAMTLHDVRPSGQIPRDVNPTGQTDTSFASAGTWKHRRKDGSFIYVEVLASPVEFGGQRARLVSINDVTDRQRLEDQIRQLQKMESIGQLAAGVAHDFNNLLTVIRGHADMMTVHGLIDPSVGEPLREIAQAAERATNLTRQLLMFSRKQVLQPKVVDLSEIVKNLTKLLTRTLGEHVELTAQCARETPAVWADAGMMEQVITNLAVNARDAMPKGGKLQISTSTVTLDESYQARNREARKGEFVCLTVADTGCGMDTATINRIFEPFFTTKEVGKGTGLGLATVYGIVKQHQGWIEVSSRVGEGSMFKVFLPVCNQRARPTDTETRSGVFPRGTETILLVEDEAPLRELAGQVLQRCGYKIIPASSGLKALELWREHAPGIDLVLTDMVMPEGVSGRDLAEKVHEDRPEMKILFVSGYSVDLVGDNFVLREGYNFLAKPYNPQSLLQAVRKCLDSRARQRQGKGKSLAVQ